MALRLSRALTTGALASFYIAALAMGCSDVQEGREACSGDECVAIQRCETTDQCASGSYCGPEGECKADCLGDQMCPQGQVCSNRGQCIPEQVEVPPVLPPSVGGISGIGGIPNVAGSGGSGGSGGSCVKAEVTFSKVIPNIMLVVDRSSSMEKAFGDGNRWNVLREALIDPIEGFVTELEDEVRFGLTLYTNPPSMMPPGRGGGGGGRGGGIAPPPNGGAGGGGGASGGGGGVSAGNGGQSTDGGALATGGTSSGGAAATCPFLVEVPVALNNLSAISSVYLPDDWRNGTPTGESLAVVWPKLAAIDQNVMPGPNFIILATDGEPNSCGGFGEQDQGRQASIEAVTAAKNAGINTYVISVGNDVGEDHLRELANVGQGEPIDDPTDRFHVATDTAGLVEALREIIIGVRPCEFELEGTVDPERAADGIVVIDGQELAYGDPNGWTLVSETKIALQGSGCDLIREGATQINIDFPCGVFIPEIPE